MVSEAAGRRLRIAALGLCIIAGALLVFLLATAAAPDGQGWGAPLVLLALHGLARRYPLQVLARGHATEVPTSTMFAFGLLLTAPLEIAVLGLAVTALIPTRIVRSPRWIRPIIEVARTALVYGAAGSVLHVLGDPSRQLVVLEGTNEASWQLLLVVLPAGMVAYLVDLAIGVGISAVEHGRRPAVILRQDRASYDLPVTLLLVGLSPAVVVISAHSLLLAPLVLLVIVAMYRASRIAVLQRHEALHDGLTGLANRRHLDERLEALMRLDRHLDPFALYVMDLDRFKEVNDQLGHQIGDRLLAQVGARLAKFEGLDLAARIGGDEFAFVVRSPLEDEELVRLGEDLVREVSRPYVISDVRLTIGASIGVAWFPHHGTDVSSLLRRADTAMYGAKRSGVPVGVAASEVRPVAGRVSLVSRLEEAIRLDELQLDYQPQVNLADGRVVAFEALLRWNHPQHGLILPSDFVPTVEHTDLITAMTRHVLRIALLDAAVWHEAGYPLPVAVNISTRDLLDKRLARDVGALLELHGFTPNDLILEITETALQVDPRRSAQVLEELRELGVRLSIDDFGTGYSSLAALQHLPVEELKVDRAFVGRMNEPSGLAIVRSVVQLAHALDLTVVAEGVEDEDTMRELLAHGCDQAQGYFVSRPLLPMWVVPWLASHAQRPPSAKRDRFGPAPIKAPRQRLAAAAPDRQVARSPR